MKMNGPGMTLGLDPATIALAAGAVDAFTGGGGGGGGAAPMPPMSQDAKTVFQQQFTPQFSPTMQMQQDSAGATQAATPTQIATGGQTAVPSDVAPATMPTSPRAMPSFPSPWETPVLQTSDNMGNLIKWGVIGLVGILVVTQFAGNGKGKKKGASSRNGKPARKMITVN